MFGPYTVLSMHQMFSPGRVGLGVLSVPYWLRRWLLSPYMLVGQSSSHELAFRIELDQISMFLSVPSAGNWMLKIWVFCLPQYCDCWCSYLQIIYFDKVNMQQLCPSQKKDAGALMIISYFLVASDIYLLEFDCYFCLLISLDTWFEWANEISLANDPIYLDFGLLDICHREEGSTFLFFDGLVTSNGEN